MADNRHSGSIIPAPQSPATVLPKPPVEDNMRQVFLVGLLTALMCGIAAAPATRPAGNSWPGAVTALARAVAENDAQALPSLLASEVTIQRFNGDSVSPARLFALPAQRTLLFTRAYPQLPDSLATDLADAATAWKQPEVIKAGFTLIDPNRRKSADQTARRWLIHSLQAKPTDPIGVAALWCQDLDNGNPGQIMFILVKGQPTLSGDMRIGGMVFGEPLADSE
jgi:hypothetical protein